MLLFSFRPPGRGEPTVGVGHLGDPRLIGIIGGSLHEGRGESNWEQNTSSTYSRAPSAVEEASPRLHPKSQLRGHLPNVSSNTLSRSGDLLGASWMEP